jgi:hypothetical protein
MRKYLITAFIILVVAHGVGTYGSEIFESVNPSVAAVGDTVTWSIVAQAGPVTISDLYSSGTTWGGSWWNQVTGNSSWGVTDGALWYGAGNCASEAAFPQYISGVTVSGDVEFTYDTIIPPIACQPLEDSVLIFRNVACNRYFLMRLDHYQGADGCPLPVTGTSRLFYGKATPNGNVCGDATGYVNLDADHYGANIDCVAKNTWYSMRVRTCGITIFAKTWVSGTSEPSGWQLSTTDPDLATYTSGSFGFQANNGQTAFRNLTVSTLSSQNVHVTDNVPTCMSNVAVVGTPSQGSVSLSGNSVNWNVGTMGDCSLPATLLLSSNVGTCAVGSLVVNTASDASGSPGSASVSISTLETNTPTLTPTTIPTLVLSYTPTWTWTGTPTMTPTPTLTNTVTPTNTLGFTLVKSLLNPASGTVTGNGSITFALQLCTSGSGTLGSGVSLSGNVTIADSSMVTLVDNINENLTYKWNHNGYGTTGNITNNSDGWLNGTNVSFNPHPGGFSGASTGITLQLTNLVGGTCVTLLDVYSENNFNLNQIQCGLAINSAYINGNGGVTASPVTVMYICGTSTPTPNQTTIDTTTPTPTRTFTTSPTWTNTAGVSVTATWTMTSGVGAATFTPTPDPTPILTPGLTTSSTFAVTPSPTWTATLTPSSTDTFTTTRTWTPTATWTMTSGAGTATFTPTPDPTPILTPGLTTSPTFTVTPSRTWTATPTPSSTDTFTPTQDVDAHWHSDQDPYADFDTRRPPPRSRLRRLPQPRLLQTWTWSVSATSTPTPTSSLNFDSDGNVRCHTEGNAHVLPMMGAPIRTFIRPP